MLVGSTYIIVACVILRIFMECTLVMVCDDDAAKSIVAMVVTM